MKNKLVLIIFTLIFGNLLAFAQTRNEGIFRYVDLGEGRKISLGQEFTKIENLFIKTEIGFRLKPDTFGVAKDINIFLANNKIKAIFFDYFSNEKTFEQKVASYTKSLGKPKSNKNFDSNSIKVNVVYWEDNRTRFELIKKTEREKVSLSSAMFDKE